MSDTIKDIIVVILVALVLPIVSGMVYYFIGDVFPSGFIIGLKIDAIIAVVIIIMFLIAIISA